MSYTQFLLYLLMYIKKSKLVSFTAFDDKHLDVENLKMYTTMSYKMCLRECSKTMRCMSINYNSDQLECFLLETSHPDSTLSDHTGFIYAFPEPGQKCDECESDDTCIQLHNGLNVCMKTECTQERPFVQNAAASKSYNPPFVSFEWCLTGYSGVGSLASSTCRPGEPWISIDYRCEPPGVSDCDLSTKLKWRGGCCMQAGACALDLTPSQGVHFCSYVHGGWSAWRNDSFCTVTCGGGSYRLTRTCTNPTPVYGGNSCHGSNTSSSTCNPNDCPLNGGWSIWGSWGSCSKTCGGGIRDALRLCNNPSPQYGGTSCIGSTSKTEACNTDSCSGGGFLIGRR